MRLVGTDRHAFFLARISISGHVFPAPDGTFHIPRRALGNYFTLEGVFGLQSNRASIACILLACVCWSFGGLLSKLIPWNALTIAGFRALIAAIVLGAARKSYRPSNTFGTWLGAFGVMSTSVLFIFANKLTSAANAIVLQYAMPVVVILFEAVVRHRKPSKLDVVSVLVVLAGVILCFCQGLSGGGMLGNVLALGSAFIYAIVYLAAHRADCDALSYSYQGNLVAALLVLYMPFDQGVTADAGHFIAALGMGVCLTLGYLFFSFGMRRGVSAVTAAIVSNIEPILNPTWCFLFLGENPGPLSIAGAAIVLAAVTGYTILSSRRRA